MINTSSGIRFVKCPKCHNVLPEPNVPVYRCGGCNITLRAKHRATSGETTTTESTQKFSMDFSEKDSFNEAPSVSEQKSSLLNNSSEKATEEKVLNSTEMQMASTEKIDASGSEKPESLSHENLNSTSNITQNRPKEEHVETGGNKEELSKENHASVPTHRVDLLHLDDRLKQQKVHKRKETTSTSSEEFHSARNIVGLESEKLAPNKPKAAAAYRKPLKSSYSYEVLQADILSRVDKLRNELVELFGKVPEEIDLSHLVQAEHESSRYRRIRITPQENTGKPHPHHYHFQTTQKPLPANISGTTITRAHKHGRRHQSIPKNHCRPILVGAPFVICSDCFKLIQLPADFNVSTKRLRKLQCGNCLKILLYSYRPQPYNSNDTTPLTPSESEMDTSSHNDAFGRGDPISISEGYGVSFGISYSTDPDPGPPLHVSRNSSYSTNNGRSGRERVGSRLHQIMGYESASEILLRQASEISVRNDRSTERERKGKGIINEHSEIGSSNSRLKRFGQDSPKLSGIHGLIKKGIIKFKPSLN